MTNMHKEPDLGGEIWAGNLRAVEKARERFNADPVGQFVPWVSTLYSFRTVPKYRVELEKLHPRIVRHARLDQVRKVESDPATLADQLDVLTTILEWSLRELPLEDPELAFRVAMNATEAALRVRTMRVQEPGGHTVLLLFLTRAALHLYLRTAENRELAAKVLSKVAQGVHLLQDQNQKARVYRKLGVLHLKLWDASGLWYLAKALLVKDAARGVHWKTLLFWRR